MNKVETFLNQNLIKSNGSLVRIDKLVALLLIEYDIKTTALEILNILEGHYKVYSQNNVRYIKNARFVNSSFRSCTYKQDNRKNRLKVVSDIINATCELDSKSVMDLDVLTACINKFTNIKVYKRNVTDVLAKSKDVKLMLRSNKAKGLKIKRNYNY